MVSPTSIQLVRALIKSSRMQQKRMLKLNSKRKISLKSKTSLKRQS